MKKRFHLIIAVFLILSMVFGSGLVHKHAYAEDAQAAASISNQEVQETQETPETPAAEEQAQVPTQKVENQTESSSNEKALLSQTIQATIYTSSTYREKLTGDKTSITLKGKLPENAVVKAYPAKLENDTLKQKNVLAAYDITIFDAQGNEFEPDSAHPIEVTIDSNSIKEKKDSSHLNIYHMDNAKAKPEAVNVKSVGTDKVIFEAKKFSIYVVAEDATPAEKGTSLQIDSYVALEPNGSATMQMSLSSDYSYQNVETSIRKTGDGDITVTPSINDSGNGTLAIKAGKSTGDASFRVTVSYEFRYYSQYWGWSAWYSTSETKTVNVSILPKATEDSTQQGNITYSKTADKTESRTTSGDPIYNLNLSFTGQKSNFVKKQRVNVVFIVDTSYSMSKESNGSEDRIQAAKDAINEFVKVAGKKSDTNPNGLDIDARYALVRFSGDKGNRDEAYNDATILQGWSSFVDTKKLTAKGGTNYEAGLLAANNLLRNDHTNATKLVIFLTDGEPTFYYDKSGYTDGDGWRYDEDALSAAQIAVGNLSLKSSDYFYAIGCGDADESTLEKLASAANCNNGHIKKARADDLSNAFQEIAAGTTTVDINKVTITDELSSNVDLVDANKIKVQYQKANGTGDYTNDTKNWDITIDSDGKKVTATRKSTPDKIDPEMKYVLTIPVHASESAKKDFVKTGTYPDTAAPYTGTYAGEKGYYSNTEATVKYTDTNNKEETLTYPKPVIRVYRMQIQKTFSGIDLSSKLKEKGKMTFEVTGPTGIPSMKKDFNTFGDDNALIFSVPDAGTYNVNENVTDIPGYHLVKEPTEQTVKVPDGENPIGPATVTFDNNYQRRIKVIKEDYDTQERLSLNVTFAGANSQTVTTSTTEDMYVNLDIGTYNVTESKLSKYENSIGKGLTLTVAKNGTVSLEGDNVRYAEFKDQTLTLKNKQLMKVLVKKTVEGNMGDTDKEFRFTYTIKRDGHEVKSGTFTLKHNGEWKLGYDGENYNGDLKYGDVVEITETDGNKDGYQTSYVVGNGQSNKGAAATIASLTSNNEVTFTNTRGAVAPTSMVTNSIPFIVAIAFGLLLAIKIKKNIKSKE